MSAPRYPSLYQINTRVWLTELSRTLGRAATLDDVPDAALDRLAEQGFDWIWFLSVWQTGPAGQRVSRTNPEWRREFRGNAAGLARGRHRRFGFRHHRLHRASPIWAAIAALARLRRSPSSTWTAPDARFRPQPHGPDHPWVEEHPEYFIAGTEEDLARAPQNYCRVRTRSAALSCWPTGAIRTSRAGPIRCSSTTATAQRRKR